MVGTVRGSVQWSGLQNSEAVKAKVSAAAMIKEMRRKSTFKRSTLDSLFEHARLNDEWETGELKNYTDAERITIVGIEIDAFARNVEELPFARGASVAFMPGNEGTGMNANQRAVCDEFIVISQYGGGTASLNVTVATSIVLQRFMSWR